MQKFSLGNTILRIIPVVLWTFIIVTLSILPGKDLPDVSILNFDKLAHFGAYALCYFFTWLAFKSIEEDAPLVFRIICIVYPAFIGLFMEFFQGCCIADRHFSIADAIANIAGITSAYFVVQRYVSGKSIFK